jgi:hypothetical protein
MFAAGFNDAPTTVAARMPQRSTTVPRAANDGPLTVHRRASEENPKLIRFAFRVVVSLAVSA